MSDVFAGTVVWLVFLNRSPKTKPGFCGVYAEEFDAVAACTTEFHVVAPAVMNKNVDVGTIKYWPGSYYPKAKKHEPS